MNLSRICLASMALVAMLAIVGCAGELQKYRQDEAFLWPSGTGQTRIGEAGTINNYGKTGAGFIREEPFAEGTVRTLTRETKVVRNYPTFDPKCNNYKQDVKETTTITYTFEYVVEGKVVFSWTHNQINPWAYGVPLLLGELINGGSRVAASAVAPATNIRMGVNTGPTSATNAPAPTTNTVTGTNTNTVTGTNTNTNTINP